MILLAWVGVLPLIVLVGFAIVALDRRYPPGTCCGSATSAEGDRLLPKR